MTAVTPALDVRSDFPFLHYTRERPIIYFDNAATTQKPQVVLDAIEHLYTSGIANVHRAGNFLSHSVTEQFEDSRMAVASFLGAESNEIIFVSNATQGINTLCASLVRNRPIKVLTATLEHHSNFLPWFDRGEVAPLPWKPSGEIDLASLETQLRSKPDLLAVTYASNFLGTLQPIQEIIAQAHRYSVPVLIDASQAAAHIRIDVRELNCDYLVFSGHKVYGPSGIGVLFVRDDHITALQPATLGGGMVKEVHRDGFVLNDVPLRFEAGTPHIEGAIGLAAALRYLEGRGFYAIAAHEQRLTHRPALNSPHSPAPRSSARQPISRPPRFSHSTSKDWKPSPWRRCSPHAAASSFGPVSTVRNPLMMLCASAPPFGYPSVSTTLWPKSIR